MATGSALVAFKKGLRNALTLRAGLAGVTVSYAFPTTQLSAEHIWLGGASSDNQLHAMRGSGPISVREDFRLQLVVQVLKTQSEGQEAADDRAVAVFAEVQQELAETPQTIPGVLLAQLAGWDHVVGPFEGTGSAHGSRFEATVRVQAVLAP